MRIPAAPARIGDMAVAEALDFRVLIRTEANDTRNTPSCAG
jgi:hypothetical protein